MTKDGDMTTYADLLYEAADSLDQAANRLTMGAGLKINPYSQELVQQSEKIREALRTSPANVALSTEDVERIKKRYDPTGSMYQDIHELANSHEQIRREKDTADSIAERFATGWCSIHVEWWKASVGKESQEPMTQDQIDWFEARK
jgi:uncharacterized protein Yka (UPF0111/DUF47 family)